MILTIGTPETPYAFLHLCACTQEAAAWHAASVRFPSCKLDCVFLFVLCRYKWLIRHLLLLTRTLEYVMILRSFFGDGIGR